MLSILAARAGKDAYCEKPLLPDDRRRPGAGRDDAALRHGMAVRHAAALERVYRFVVDVVRGGMIGKLHTITTLLGGWGGNGVATPEPPPDPECSTTTAGWGRRPGPRIRRSAWPSGGTTGTPPAA